MKKQLAIAIAAAFTVAAPLAQAAYDRYGNWHDDERGDRRDDVAHVIDSRPVYADNGRQECWNPHAQHYEEVRDTRGSTVKGGTVGGAVVGGVVGHQFDHGSAGATLGGALIGGLIGNQVDKSHNDNAQNDLDYSRCRPLAGSEASLQGYETRYEYRGREYTAMLPQQPGPELFPGREIRENGTPR